MKKIALVLAAALLLSIAAVASATCPGNSDGKAAFGEKAPSDGKCQEGQNWDREFCKKICPGKESWEPFALKEFAGNCEAKRCIECIVSEKCSACGKTFYCDGVCEECGKPVKVYEFCPACGAIYAVDFADGRCDVCGKDCYCMEKCDACGYNHYFNGYCDECASPCLLQRCCFNVCDRHDFQPCDRCQEPGCGNENHTKECNCQKGKENLEEGQQLTVIEIIPVSQTGIGSEDGNGRLPLPANLDA